MDGLGKVRYSPVINNTLGAFKTCTVDEYKNHCKTTRSGFELIPDDIPVKFYVDVEFKKPVSSDIEYTPTMCPNLINLAKDCITLAVYPTIPQFCVATSNSASYDNKGTPYHIISFHIIVVNCIALKSEQKK